MVPHINNLGICYSKVYIICDVVILMVLEMSLLWFLNRDVRTPCFAVFSCEKSMNHCNRDGQIDGLIMVLPPCCEIVMNVLP